MASDPLVGRMLADRFEILERIGEGGTGVVYKARQVAVDKTVAIKVLGAHVSSDPTWVRRFHNEARAAAKLDDPHTVRIIDFGQTPEGLLFIAMELLQGKSLRQEIDRLGKLPWYRALRIASQACQSLGEAHALSIIHRDIKPDNLYLIDKGMGLGPTTGPGGDFVKVLDFSVAKVDDPDAIKTRVGMVLGTPEYMSPEQARGGTLGPQSDLYSLGVVIYECITGKPPFTGRVPTEIVIAHVRDQPPPLVGQPDDVVRLVMKALEKDPARRQQSAAQLAQECEAALFALGASSAPTGPQPLVAMPGTTGPYPILPVGATTSPPGGTPAASPPVDSIRRPLTGPTPPQQVSAGQAGPPHSSVVAMPLPSQPGAVQAPAFPGPAPEAPAARSAPAPPVARSPGEMRTLLEGAAPQVNPSPASVAGGVLDRTMEMEDTSGLVAISSAAAQEARRKALLQAQPPVPPVGLLFWLAWVFLGIGVGLVTRLLLGAR